VGCPARTCMAALPAGEVVAAARQLLQGPALAGADSGAAC
jgi:hypothetical protein